MGSVITKGYTESKIITWGYGGTAGVQPPPEEMDEETAWTESSCAPPGSDWEESQCAPGGWVETDFEYQRISVTPGASFREASWLVPESPPTGPFDRFPGVRPAGRDHSVDLRRLIEPMGRQKPPARLVVTPIGSYREHDLPGLSVVSIQGESVTEDTYVSEPSPTTNFGNDPKFFIRWTASNTNRVAAVRFPSHSIPLTATVLSATLSLYWDTTEDFDPDRTIDAHRMLASWDESTATWSNTGGWTNAGVDFSTDSVGTAIVTGRVLNDPVPIDVKDVVQEMLDNSEADLDFRIGYRIGTVASAVAFWSSENGTSTLAPKIEVIYAG